MYQLKQILTVILIFITTCASLYASDKDVVKFDSCSRKTHPFKATQLIAPISLIAVGSVITAVPRFKSAIDMPIADAVRGASLHKTSADNFTMFVPLVAVYGLNLCGVRGKHNYRDLTMMVATSSIIAGALSFGLKYATNVKRPDGSSFDSFPSGHTTIAFMGAEILRQEYKHISAWYGVGGYLVAGATGALRIYNNRHWLTDVMVGAGIGILSAQVSYWIYPSMKNWLFPSQKRLKAMVVPYYNGQSTGIGFCSTF